MDVHRHREATYPWDRAVAKIGVKTLFQNHVYKHGETIDRQKKGGPPELQVTGRVAKIRMVRVMRKLKNILRRSGVTWGAIFIYVDDFRLALKSLKKGVRFCQGCSSIFFSLDQFREDMKSTETDSLEKDLQFTTETLGDFKSGKLPTLDFQMLVRQEEVPATRWGGGH